GSPATLLTLSPSAVPAIITSSAAVQKDTRHEPVRRPPRRNPAAHEDGLARQLAQLQLRTPLRPCEHASRSVAREQRRSGGAGIRVPDALPSRHGDRHLGALGTVWSIETLRATRVSSTRASHSG